nr:hypothetical protein CFP56_11505 [Quercus suber]
MPSSSNVHPRVPRRTVWRDTTNNLAKQPFLEAVVTSRSMPADTVPLKVPAKSSLSDLLECSPLQVQFHSGFRNPPQLRSNLIANASNIGPRKLACTMT